MAKNNPKENKASKLDDAISQKISDIEKQTNEFLEERLVMQDQTVKAKKEALALMERQQSRQEELNKLSQKWKDNWRDFKEIASDPKIAGGLFLVASADKAKDIAGSFMDMQKTAGLAYTQTANMAGVLSDSVSSGFMVGVGFKDAAEAAGALSEELGDLGDVTSGAVKNVASMAHSYGVSNAESAKLIKAVKNISGESTDVASNMLETAKNMAISANVAPGKVIKDMASNTELMAGFSKNGSKNFTETAIQAAKLGISLSDVSSMLNGILDVESSIEKEMEASVLLNRQISFDKARQLAMNGDTLGATKAILEQVGGIAEWENMSIMQRKSLAEAAGVELGVMNSMISSRDKQIEMGLVEASNSEKTLKTLMGMGSTIKNNATWLAATANLGASIFKAENFAMVKKAAFWVKERAHEAAMFLMGKKKNLLSEAQIKAGFGGKAAKDKLLGVTSSKTTTPISGGKKGAGTGGGLTKSIEKMKPGKLLAGAAAMVIVAAAVFVFGKAVQEFMKVSWKAVGMAVVSMIALVGAVALLGAIMSSGVGAIAIIAGAAAMLIVASAVYVLGKALQEMATGFEQMGAITSQLVELVMLAPAMVLAAAGFVAMGYGLVALSAGLLLLTPMLPVLMALGGLTAIGMSLFGGGEGEDKAGGGDNVIAEKLDTLIDLISQGGTINMDGKKVGDVIALAQGPLGS